MRARSVRGNTGDEVRAFFRLSAVVAAALLPVAVASAANLDRQALEAFNHYTERARAQCATHCTRSEFLKIDSSPAMESRVHDGEIVVTPVGHTPLKVPDGLIHDWIGTAFIPGITIQEVLAMVRDYGHYSEYYAPQVIQSQALRHADEDYHFRMLMMNQSLFSKSALEGEYAESFVRVDNQDWYSIASSTSIRQVDHVGEPDETLLPDGEGSGYIWRLMSISKFEQRDGGVYVQMEVIALSRGIPASLRWIVDPIVRRVARGSLETSLEKTRAAVNSTEATARRTEPERTAPPAVSLTSAWR